MSIVYESPQVVVHHGDCIEVMKTLPDASVDSIVTDPPYGLEFMGKDWDAPWKATGTVERRVEEGTDASHPFRDGATRVRYGVGAGFGEWCRLWAVEALRVLKPGGHMVAFGGTRTWHRLAVAVEDAGFEIRDSIAWMYGSGFPKSMDVSKAIDKEAGADREVEARSTVVPFGSGNPRCSTCGRSRGSQPANCQCDTTGTPATDAAQQWAGWGTALKPAFEPVVVARKPLAGTVAQNVLKYGTGALNIDASRVGNGTRTNPPARSLGNGVNMSGGKAQAGREATTAAGRFPANVILDESQAAELDKQSGHSKSPTSTGRGAGGQHGITSPRGAQGRVWAPGDEGGASRFFYTAKASPSERPVANGIAHPTVKPLDLMRWLVRLVTPTGGKVLEPFAGSGTTLEAAVLEGFTAIGIERETDYLPLIEQRLDKPHAVGLDIFGGAA